MQHTKQVLDWDNRNIFKNKRTFTLDEDLVDKIDSIEYGAQVNVIEEIQVNWVPQEPDPAKAVNIHVPRVINALTSDSEEDALSAKMWKYLYSLFQQTGVLYRYRWSVATFDDLPESWNQQWDVYNILDTGMNYAWTWTEWDALWWSIYTAWYWIEISDTNVISAVRQPDHYLWHWNCIEWQSPDFLETAPYDYNAWDYYIVNKTADMSWTKRIEMLWGEYHIPSLEEFQELLDKSESLFNTRSSSSDWAVITNLWLPNWVAHFEDRVIIPEEEAYEFIGLWLSDWYMAYEWNEVDIRSLNNNNEPLVYAYMLQIRAFKDEPVIPDNTWTQVVDWSETCWIAWTWIYKKESLWLITFVFPWRDEDLGEYTNELSYMTTKDKNEWATEFEWEWYYYQWWNCNPVTLNIYEYNDETIDFSNIQPSTYSSNKIDYKLEHYTNGSNARWEDEAWENFTARQWPCQSWWHVPDDDNESYADIIMYLHAYATWEYDESLNDTSQVMAYYSPVLSDYYSRYWMWHIIPIKNTPLEPDETWDFICSIPTKIKSSNAQIMLYHNSTLWVFTSYIDDWLNPPHDALTFSDKFLWATEICDPLWEYLEKWSVTISKAKFWNTYQWWNNYAFDLLPKPIELIFKNVMIPSSFAGNPLLVEPKIEQIISEKNPYWYNWNIIFCLPSPFSWWTYTEQSILTKELKKWDTKTSNGNNVSNDNNVSTTHLLNSSLWNYVLTQYNLRPKWTSYVEDSTTDSEIETERVDINDIYLYDWTQWILMDNHIVPHVFVTQTEYNGISDKKYHNWTLYLFVDRHPWDPENPCDNLWEYEQFEELAQWEDYDPSVIKSTRDVTIHDSAPQRAQAICDRLNWCLSGYRSKFYWDSNYRNDHFIHTSWWYLFWKIDTWWTLTELEVYDASTWYIYFFVSDDEQWTWEVESYQSWWGSAV